jgi:tRNA splicing endonuclease
MSEENSGFKVADKRLFTEDGDLRENVRTESVEDKSADHSALNLEDSQEKTTQQDIPMTFQTLVFSLSTTAMMQLGILSHPEGAQQKDLGAAKQTIDILEILQEKTKGNLTVEESQLLEASVYDLKMTYLKMTNAIRL